MELAGRVYDTITNPNHVLPEMLYLVPKSGEHEFTYWRRVVRMAALCHDLGHLPFSHAA
jgi:HD superfamily phosphohydrolase